MNTTVLPFRVLCIAPFGSSQSSEDGPLSWFGYEPIDEIISRQGVSVRVEVPRKLHEDGYIDLSIKNFKDFRPDKILLSNEFTRNIVAARDLALDLIKQGIDTAQILEKVRQVPGLGEITIPSRKQAPAKDEKTSSSIEELLKIVAIPDEQKDKNRDVAFMCFDNTVGGSSLGYQLLLSMTAQFLMWCKDHFVDNLDPAELEDSLRAVLVALWQKRGYEMSERINFNVTPLDKGGYCVGLTLDLPRSVLREGGTISLEIPW